MARAARRVERLDIGADEHAPIVAWMTRLAAAADGWINLVPHTADDADRETSLPFFALLNGNGLGVTMCTWLPARQGGRRRTEPTLGITHVAKGRAVGRLQSLGITIPERWVVEQDHPRRGLVLRIADGTPHEEVLGWAMRAAAALAPGPARTWTADVHLPVHS